MITDTLYAPERLNAFLTIYRLTGNPAGRLFAVNIKYFTLPEANRTLPLVRRIVTDITVLYPEWRELVARYELAAAGAKAEWGESPEQLELRSRIEDIAGRITVYMSELEAIGCVFKGFQDGLIDFYGKLDGRDVFWCWKQGEDRIEHWHEIEAGFAGRQPVPG